jgi:hypothetical protein
MRTLLHTGREFCECTETADYVDLNRDARSLPQGC